MIRRPIKSTIKPNYDRKELEEFEKENEVSYHTTVVNWFSDVVTQARSKVYICNAHIIIEQPLVL